MAATLGLSPSELALLLAPPLAYTCVYIPFCKYALGGRPRPHGAKPRFLQL